MMDSATLLTFAGAALALALTPGPDMLLVMTRSVAQGRVAGLTTLGGITVGCFGHALIAGFSLSGMLLIAPVMFELIRWAGAAYCSISASRLCAVPAASGRRSPARRAYLWCRCSVRDC
jgi:threonine/homoserine/homoserine lactone efflux protein